MISRLDPADATATKVGGCQSLTGILILILIWPQVSLGHCSINKNPNYHRGTARKLNPCECLPSSSVVASCCELGLDWKLLRTGVREQMWSALHTRLGQLMDQWWWAGRSELRHTWRSAAATANKHLITTSTKTFRSSADAVFSRKLLLHDFLVVWVVSAWFLRQLAPTIRYDRPACRWMVGCCCLVRTFQLGMAHQMLCNAHAHGAITAHDNRSSKHPWRALTQNLLLR